MKTNRPILELPMSRMEWILELFTIVLVCLVFAVVALYWNKLPESVVVHFDISGKADHNGPKTILLVLAGLNVVNYAVLSVLARFPHTFNYVRPITKINAEQQYLLARKFLNVLKLETTGLMFFCIWSCIQATVDGTHKCDVGNLMTLMVLLLLSVGIYMFRAYKMPY